MVKEAELRELFTQLGGYWVAGTLPDNVVKGTSSDDDTLLKFMRKVRMLLCIMLVVEQPAPATFLNSCPALAQVEFGEAEGKDRNSSSPCRSPAGDPSPLSSIFFRRIAAAFA
jgi:hypothetical protein